MAEARNIALFGGTFDPIHLGHIHLARIARDTCALDQVRFLPCRISPHKRGTAPTPASDRLAMLEIATQSLPWAVVDEVETLRAGPSYSYETAEEMQRRFPDARLFWIMGGDQWSVLPSWRNAGRLAELVEFIVLARGSDLPEHEGYRMHLVTGEHPASASMIRDGLRSDGPSSQWLDPKVAAYINQRGLYRHPCEDCL